MEDHRIAYESFFEQLLGRIPELRPTHDEHVAYWGELLDHLLMADITRYVIEAFRKSQGESVEAAKCRQIVLRTLDFLEKAFRSRDENLNNLIAASFIENLLDEPELGKGLRELLGPESRKELVSMENWKPTSQQEGRNSQ